MTDDLFSASARARVLDCTLRDGGYASLLELAGDWAKAPEDRLIWLELALRLPKNGGQMDLEVNGRVVFVLDTAVTT